MDANLLIECGFTENQAKVYLLLLKNAGISAGQISKNLFVDRSFVYDILRSLTKKGLVYSSALKNTKIFFAEPPQRILDNLESQTYKAKAIIKKIDKSKERLAKSRVEVYEGNQAIRKYLLEIINSTQFLTLGGGGRLNIFNILKYDYPHYMKKLKKEKISGKIICSNQNKEFWESNLKNTFIEIKSVEGAGKDNSITILKDKIILSEESENPNIIIVNNANHAHLLGYYFSYLWDKLTKH